MFCFLFSRSPHHRHGTGRKILAARLNLLRIKQLSYVSYFSGGKVTNLFLSSKHSGVYLQENKYCAPRRKPSAPSPPSTRRHRPRTARHRDFFARRRDFSGRPRKNSGSSRQKTRSTSGPHHPKPIRHHKQQPAPRTPAKLRPELNINTDTRARNRHPPTCSQPRRRSPPHSAGHTCRKVQIKPRKARIRRHTANKS